MSSCRICIINSVKDVRGVLSRNDIVIPLLYIMWARVSNMVSLPMIYTMANVGAYAGIDGLASRALAKHWDTA